MCLLEQSAKWSKYACLEYCDFQHERVIGVIHDRRDKNVNNVLFDCHNVAIVWDTDL